MDDGREAGLDRKLDALTGVRMLDVARAGDQARRVQSLSSFCSLYDLYEINYVAFVPVRAIRWYYGYSGLTCDERVVDSET